MASAVNRIVKGAAAGIGLASESYTAHKEKKRAATEHSTSNNEDSRHHQGQDHPHEARETDQRAVDHDELHWELDEAQEELTERSHPEVDPPPAYDSESDTLSTPKSEENNSKPKEKKNPARQAQLFLAKYPSSSITLIASQPLPFPVVLPQRRPHDRSRGFVRAYAPILDTHSIEQDMFLDFIETFDRASQASPWINAINLASLFTSFLPEAISMAVSVAIRIATKVAIEMQGRERYASFTHTIHNR